MMNGKEPGKTDGPIEVEIPRLKAQKREKKGAGILLPGQAAGNAAAIGGAGAAQAGAKAGLAALFTGKIGAAALVAGLGGAGLVGYGVMQQQGKSAPTRKPELGGLSSSISVGKRNAKGSKSLSYMAKAGEGELRWDDPNAPKKDAGRKGAESTEEDLADSAGAPSQEALMERFGGEAGANGEGAEKPSLGRMDAKLSTQLGESSAFGSKSIFSGGTGFDVARMKNLDKNNLGAASRVKTSARGKGNLRRARGKLTGKNLSTRGVRANRAMGQLKFAGRRSGQAAQTNSAGAAATYAQDAFGATSTDGGELQGGGAIGDDMPSIQPPGSGAPDSVGNGAGTGACPSNWTAAEGGGCVPPEVQGVHVGQAYEGLMKSATDMAESAQKMMAMGAALIVIGALLLLTPLSAWVGGIIIAIGVLLLGLGMQMQSQAMKMAQDIASQYGQQEQSAATQAVVAGEAPPEETHEWSPTVQDATQAESEADYSIE